MNGERRQHDTRSRVGSAGQRHDVALRSALAQVVPQAEGDRAREFFFLERVAIFPAALERDRSLGAARRPDEGKLDDLLFGIVTRAMAASTGLLAPVAVDVDHRERELLLMEREPLAANE